MNASSSFSGYGTHEVSKYAQAMTATKQPLLALLKKQNASEMSVLHIPVPYLMRPYRFDIEEIESVIITPFFQGIKILIGDVPSQNSVLWMGLLFLLPFLLVARYFEIYAQNETPSKPVMSDPIVESEVSIIKNDHPQTPKTPLDKIDFSELEDTQIIDLVMNGTLPSHALEKTLGDYTRAVTIRRHVLDAEFKLSESELPFLDYDYSKIFGQCCENVVGYVPIPVGVAGPFIIDNQSYWIPMATTEGCLVASTSRGCKAINLGGGAMTVLTNDGMTRGPVVRFPRLADSNACKTWIESVDGLAYITQEFNSTSRFAKLKKIKVALAGRLLYMRFVTFTGDAMGMNMVRIVFVQPTHIMIDIQRN